MTVLVDQAIWPYRGRRFAHLASDRSLAELHAFAAEVGLPPRAFHGDHYDVPDELVAAAVAHGAVEVDARELVRRLRQAGLRRRPGAHRPEGPGPVTRCGPSGAGAR